MIFMPIFEFQSLIKLEEKNISKNLFRGGFKQIQNNHLKAITKRLSSSAYWPIMGVIKNIPFQELCQSYYNINIIIATPNC